jgi:predicted porin
MKKKLLAVAVAGALAAPGLALAQSSVTISGIFKMSLDNVRIGSPTARLAGTNTSETRLADDSSRVLFNVVEDLGGGLQAIAQLDWRIQFDQGADNIGGNNHVGLRSKTLGRIFVGRQDLHYFNRESNLTDLAGSLKADSISLIAYAGGGAIPIAAATRTPNVIHYTSPNWGGFTVVGAYSTSPNPGGATVGTAAAGTAGGATGVGANGSVTESDIGSPIRRGRAWNINPNFEAANWQVGWSHWDSRPDFGTAAATTAAQTLGTGDQRSDRLYGSFKIAGFKIGLAWDKSRIRTSTAVAAGASPTAAAIGSGTEISNRTAWSLPVSYIIGNNQFHAHYTKARDDTALAGDQGAKMFALSYQYTLSKRTSLGLTYAKITNNAGAAYNFFTATSLGSASAGVVAGEDPRMFAGTIRHAF